jgi:hypothetical protein
MVHEAIMTVCQVANAVGTAKVSPTSLALTAQAIVGSTFQFKQQLQEGLPLVDPFLEKVILTLFHQF